MKNILVKPVISEKALGAQDFDKYVFHVSLNANKNMVKKEVERLFKVDVVSVNITRIPGKVKRVGRIFGRRSEVKKATVLVKKGQKIEEFKV